MDNAQFLICLLLSGIYSCSKTSKTTELIQNLTTNYDSDVRPGLDSEGPLVVNISFNLVALTKLNEVEGYISTVQFFDIT